MKLLIASVGVMLLSLAVGVGLLTRANPEVAFWSELYGVRLDELRPWMEDHPDEPVVIFTGGSSCAFSVDPAVVSERTGLRAHNMGGPAGAGARYLVAKAMVEARAGDIVILALERHFLTEEDRTKPTQLGLSLALHDGEVGLAGGEPVFGDGADVPETVAKLRPGTRFVATLAGKKLAGRAPYRYTMADHRGGGRLETQHRDAWMNPVGALERGTLSDEGRRFLETVRDYASVHGISVAYSLPWMLTDPDHAAGNRRVNARLLGEIAGVVPVIDDPALGVWTDREAFADSEYHLAAKGVSARSAAIADGIAGCKELRGRSDD